MCRSNVTCRLRSLTPWPRLPAPLVLDRWRAVRLSARAITPTRWRISMQAEIIMPEVGAGALVLSFWFAEVGESVFEGDRLVEVLVGGATFDVPAPATGRLAEKRALGNDPLRPGQVLGVIEAEHV